MRATFLMCCSTTNHRASDECDNAQSCRVFPPLLSLVISSQIRLRTAHSGDTLTVSQLSPSTLYNSDEGTTVWCCFAIVPWKCLHFSMTLHHKVNALSWHIHYFCFLCVFSIRVTRRYNSYCSQNISKIPHSFPVWSTSLTCPKYSWNSITNGNIKLSEFLHHAVPLAANYIYSLKGSQWV